jgi:stage II sporulation protein AB (anti-sigma F factor)
LKTAVSEAVTNCIVHGYKNGEGKIVVECFAKKGETGGTLHISITDYGCGIENLEKALAPFYTTLAGEERSGMGFTIMQTFMNDVSVRSERGKGTVVEMTKKVG